MKAIKKSTNKNTKKLRGKPSSVEGKTMGQIQSIHYNKIEIITLKLYPKPEFTINWENTIIHLGTNTTSPNCPRKNFNLYSLCVLSKKKKKSHFPFSLSAAQSTNIFPSIGFKNLFHSSVSLWISLLTTCTQYIVLYKAPTAWHTPKHIRNRSLKLVDHFSPISNWNRISIWAGLLGAVVHPNKISKFSLSWLLVMCNHRPSYT